MLDPTSKRQTGPLSLPSTRPTRVTAPLTLPESEALKEGPATGFDKTRFHSDFQSSAPTVNTPTAPAAHNPKSEAPVAVEFPKKEVSPEMQTQVDTLTAKFQTQVQAWARSDPAGFQATMVKILGSKADPKQLLQQALTGTFPLPAKIEFLSAEALKGANGAYNAQGGGTIYLNKNLLNQPAKLFAVFSEESGHHLDATLKGPDAKGDEGELFRVALLNRGQIDQATLQHARNDSDQGWLEINGQAVQVEFDRGDGGADDYQMPILEGREDLYQLGQKNKSQIDRLVKQAIQGDAQAVTELKKLKTQIHKVLKKTIQAYKDQGAEPEILKTLDQIRAQINGLKFSARGLSYFQSKMGQIHQSVDELGARIHKAAAKNLSVEESGLQGDFYRLKTDLSDLELMVEGLDSAFGIDPQLLRTIESRFLDKDLAALVPKFKPGTPPEERLQTLNLAVKDMQAKLTSRYQSWGKKDLEALPEFKTLQAMLQYTQRLIQGETRDPTRMLQAIKAQLAQVEEPGLKQALQSMTSQFNPHEDRLGREEILDQATQELKALLAPDKLQEMARAQAHQEGFWDNFETLKGDLEGTLEKAIHAYKQEHYDDSPKDPVLQRLEEAYQALKHLNAKRPLYQVLGDFKKALAPFSQSMTELRHHPNSPVLPSEYTALASMEAAFADLTTLPSLTKQELSKKALDYQMGFTLDNMAATQKQLGQVAQQVLKNPALKSALDKQAEIQKMSQLMAFFKSAGASQQEISTLKDQMLQLSDHLIRDMLTSKDHILDYLKAQNITAPANHPAPKLLDQLAQRVRAVQQGASDAELAQRDQQIQHSFAQLEDPLLKDKLTQILTLVKNQENLVKADTRIAVSAEQLSTQKEAVFKARELAQNDPNHVYQVVDEDGHYQIIKSPLSDLAQIDQALKQENQQLVFAVFNDGKGLQERGIPGLMERLAQPETSPIPQRQLPEIATTGMGGIQAQNADGLDDNPHYQQMMDKVGDHTLDVALGHFEKAAQDFAEFERLISSKKPEDKAKLAKYLVSLANQPTEKLQTYLRYFFGMEVEALNWTPGHQKSYNLALMLQHVAKAKNDPEEFQARLDTLMHTKNFSVRLPEAIKERHAEIQAKVKELKALKNHQIPESYAIPTAMGTVSPERLGMDADKIRRSAAMDLLKNSPVMRQRVFQRMGFKFPNQFPPLSGAELVKRSTETDDYSYPMMESKTYRADPTKFTSPEEMYFAFGAKDSSETGVGDFIRDVVENILIIPAVARSYNEFKESTMGVSAQTEGVDSARAKEQAFTMQMTSAVIQAASMGAGKLARLDLDAFTSKLGKFAAEQTMDIAATVIDGVATAASGGDVVTNIMVNLASAGAMSGGAKGLEILRQKFGSSAPQLAIRDNGDFYLTHGKKQLELSQKPQVNAEGKVVLHIKGVPEPVQLELEMKHRPGGLGAKAEIRENWSRNPFEDPGPSSAKSNPALKEQPAPPPAQDSAVPPREKPSSAQPPPQTEVPTQKASGDEPKPARAQNPTPADQGKQIESKPQPDMDSPQADWDIKRYQSDQAARNKQLAEKMAANPLEFPKPIKDMPDTRPVPDGPSVSQRSTGPDSRLKTRAKEPVEVTKMSLSSEKLKETFLSEGWKTTEIPGVYRKADGSIVKVEITRPARPPESVRSHIDQEIAALKASGDSSPRTQAIIEGLEKLRDTQAMSIDLAHSTQSSMFSGLEASDGKLLSAKSLEARDIKRSSGEGDSFSGVSGAKDEIYFGYGKEGLGTSMAYFNHSANSSHYNLSRLSDTELKTKIDQAQAIVENWDKVMAHEEYAMMHSAMQDVLPLPREKYESLLRSYQTELERRGGQSPLPAELAPEPAYPVMFALDADHLSVHQVANAGQGIQAEATVSKEVDLKDNLKTVFVPVAQMKDMQAKLDKLLGPGHQVEIIPMEALEKAQQHPHYKAGQAAYADTHTALGKQIKNLDQMFELAYQAAVAE